jgi:hypothetical protein
MSTNQDKSTGTSTTGTTGTSGPASGKPSWWDESHSQNWVRAREHLRSEWEMGGGTGAVTGKSGTTGTGSSSSGMGKDSSTSSEHGKGSGIGSVIAGTTTLGNKGDWSHVEPAMRYGHGAYTHYSKEHTDWDDRLHDKLQGEWTKMNASHPWESIKQFVRKGWDAARRKT